MHEQSDQYYLAFARDLAIEAGNMAEKQFRNSHGWLKGDSSWVTQTDVDIQAMLEEAIKNRFPDHHFLGEEEQKGEKSTSGEGFLWVVDPIDGTDSFATGLPVWGISIALLRDGDPLVGVFYQPITRELYCSTTLGDPSLVFQPGRAGESVRAIHVAISPTFDGRSALFIPSDFQRYFNSDFKGKHRSLGSVAAHVAAVARGAGVGAIFNCHLWDIAAVELILRQAGGGFFNLETEEPLYGRDYANASQLPWTIAAGSKENFLKLKSSLTLRS